MAKFTGWNPTDLVSRVDVTKFICNYIKEKDLQNPADRRQIVPDPSLGKLLNYDSKTAENPLTYFRMQSLMKDHFIRSEPTA
jgi:chromatin remodeling complex protein RSC6